MTFIITEIVQILDQGSPEARLLVRDFLAVLKTHWWLSAIYCSFVGLLFLSPFPISILNFNDRWIDERLGI